jgi:hypothetical protein
VTKLLEGPIESTPLTDAIATYVLAIEGWRVTASGVKQYDSEGDLDGLLWDCVDAGWDVDITTDQSVVKMHQYIDDKIRGRAFYSAAPHMLSVLLAKKEEK